MSSQVISSQYRHRRPMTLQRRLGIILRLLIVLTPILMLLIGLYWVCSILMSKVLPGELFMPGQRPESVVYDPGSLLTEDETQTLTEKIKEMRQDFQTDWMLVLVPHMVSSDLPAYAKDLYHRWNLGQFTFNHRGALLLVVPEAKKVSVAIGGDLEKSFKTSPLIGTSSHYGDKLLEQSIGYYLEKRYLARSIESALRLVKENYMSATKRNLSVSLMIYPIPGEPASVSPPRAILTLPPG